MAAPSVVDIEEIKADNYEVSDDYDDYEGVPYAFQNTNFLPFTAYSFASSKVLKPDYREVFMEYAEVQFIISERNGFSEDEYENGVRASMEKWGVDEDDIEDFIDDLPDADRESVLTQKYVALYMQGHTAYAEYRRTKVPTDDVFVLPGETITLSDAQVEALAPANRVSSYVFEAQNTDVVLDELPKRLRYPQSLQTLNGANLQDAVSGLSNGDVLSSPLFWDNN